MPRLLAFSLSATSIGSLLLYFYGMLPMPMGVAILVLPAAAALALLSIGPGKRVAWSPVSFVRRGVWAGGFATVAYDLVRVPLAHAGVPVFKAISYFGTVIVDRSRPTALSELAGWTYHLSNGIGFAIMYLALVRRPRWFTAVAWGVGLELCMLATPYAEVFGYRRSVSFVAISLSAHAVYGLTLWWTAAKWTTVRESPVRQDEPRRLPRAAAWITVPAMLALVALDFFHLHAHTIPDSPPSDIGPDIFVTWSTPEPDRAGAIWLTKRFVRPKARFRFVEPMSIVRYGTPFDMPEADVRRSHSVSTFESVLAKTSHGDDPGLERLARFCHASEIAPWAPGWDAELQAMASSYAEATKGCTTLNACADAATGWFERQYQSTRAPRLNP